MANIQETYSPKQMSASGVIKAGPHGMGGVFCTTGGTLMITKLTTGGTVVVDTFTALAAVFYPLPFAFEDDSYATIGGGFVGTFAVA